MGAYINPTNMSKEEWLLDNAVEIKDTDAESWDFTDKDIMLLVWIFNGFFTALGVVEHDTIVTSLRKDKRMKTFFMVETKKVLESTPPIMTDSDIEYLNRMGY